MSPYLLTLSIVFCLTLSVLGCGRDDHSSSGSDYYHHYHHYGGYYEPYFTYYPSFYPSYSYDWYDPYYYYAARPARRVSPLQLALAKTRNKVVVHDASWTDSNCTYELTTSPALSWVDARDACNKRGALLGVVASAAASERVAEEFAVNATEAASFWIGASDNANEEIWGWVDGKVMDFADWTKTPDGGKMENCAAFDIGVNAVQSGRWNDEDCDEKKAYLCQKC